MRRRLYAVVAVAALGLALPSHADEPKKLDGSNLKKIEVKATVAQQTHDEELITSLPGIVGMSLAPDRTKCTDTCLNVPFKFSPATGVSGDVVFHVTWGAPGTDMDLAVYDSEGKTVVSCGASYGSGEIVSIPSDKLVKDATYTMSVYYYRTSGEEITATVEFPGTYTPSDTTEEPVIDCGLDG